MKSRNKKLKSNKLLIAIGAFIIFGAIMIDNDFFGSLLACFIIYVVLIKTYFKRPKKEKAMPKLTKEKEEHYSEFGMSHKEVVFFRETMATAKKQIRLLEANMHANSKLKAIDLRYDTIKTCRAMFKEIVKEPNKLHQSDRFLYNHLPNLVELTTKYIEISDHQVKNKTTYEALNKSVEAIENVSQLITNDYANFVKDDLDELDVEISIANQNIQRDKDLKKYKETEELN